jgi:hypothetical protein
MKRVLVTGGRDFALPDEVHGILFPIAKRFGIEELGQGEAEGADTLAKLWALCHGIAVAGYEAEPHEWELFGNRAGNIRNGRMLRHFKPDLGVAFPGGNGTADMVEKLHEAGVPYLLGRWANVERTKIRWRLKNG